MKFSVSSSELVKQLQIVQGAIPSNPILPILEDCLFTIANGRLQIAATDLETTITTSIDIQSDADGSIAIPARLLADTLKALPDQPVTFNCDMETYTIEIISAYGQYRLAGENGKDYPRVPDQGEAESVELHASALQQAIAKTLFATSSDDLRPAMTGVYFQLDFNKITFVATDAHRLVCYTISNDVKGEVATSFIVPKKALNLLKSALPSGNAPVSVTFNKTNAFFSFGNINLVCRLIDARFPDYQAVIPTSSPITLITSRTSLASSLRRINLYANKSTNQVVMAASKAALQLSSRDLDFANEAVEHLPCTYEGDDLTIGFNARFLIDMLGVLEGEDVRVELSSPTRAGIIRPTEQTEGEDVLMLIMPVMLSN